ncbi:probable indole-3-pyruvate monooxygenase YUCCA10 [Solanum tuberosum]|uniref:probable indole-3-pyruvate monooxygenase YUCCA10 n=1 Tax=Solanum tuberosum TaxID=4113 RepID=UPI00073A147A|nr:PREDICTED: probable indole-3-pyruvate monooxygenase YUCCA10 [Solanum tuberosum]
MSTIDGAVRVEVSTTKGAEVIDAGTTEGDPTGGGQRQNRLYALQARQDKEDSPYMVTEVNFSVSPETLSDAFSVSTLVGDPVIAKRIHVLTREMVYTAMLLLKYLPISLVDTIIAKYAKFKFGNLAELGIQQPEEGPFSFKISKGRSTVINVGAIDKIKLGQIKVLPEISKIKEHPIVFDNGDEHQFDAIIFATGYKNIATKLLKIESGGTLSPFVT